MCHADQHRYGGGHCKQEDRTFALGVVQFEVVLLQDRVEGIEQDRGRGGFVRYNPGIARIEQDPEAPGQVGFRPSDADHSRIMLPR